MSDEPENLPAVIEDESPAIEDQPPASPAWERVTDVVAMRKEIARLERELQRARRK
jgi:hypothetical protein